MTNNFIPHNMTNTTKYSVVYSVPVEPSVLSTGAVCRLNVLVNFSLPSEGLGFPVNGETRKGREVHEINGNTTRTYMNHR